MPGGAINRVHDGSRTWTYSPGPAISCADRASQPGRLTMGWGEGAAAKPFPSFHLSVLAGMSRSLLCNFESNPFSLLDLLLEVLGHSSLLEWFEKCHDLFLAVPLLKIRILIPGQLGAYPEGYVL